MNRVLSRYQHSLAVKLFSYFAIILIVILGLQNLAEIALVRSMLQIPTHVQVDMRNLAHQAESLVELGNKEVLTDWEEQQKYYLFVVDQQHNELSNRVMHPHFKFKLQFTRPLNTILDSQVSQPIISIPLPKVQATLMVQLPYQQHPAKNFSFYFGLIQIVIAVLILLLFSVLIARYLQRPLTTLQLASRKLADGDFSVRVMKEVGDSVLEFKALAQDLDIMASNIQLLAKQQKRLIRDVSHELKTPLARHDLALHLLRRRTQDQNKELLDQLEQQSDQMNTLVNEIIEFCRIDNAKYSTQLMPIQIDSICQIQFEESQRHLGLNQSLNLHLVDNFPMVMAESRLALRAIKNIIENAVKYAGSMAVIDVSTCLLIYQGRSYAAVVIEDNGVGIPSSQLKRIFDPFTRLEDSRDKQSGGYGLGLAIVKEAMMVMKGEVIAENRRSGGLRISLLFPIVE
ncbi:histidine kinase sensor domain-containing protein [Photobacterium damselae]|uniref:histidine kinase sensor domain-containing protein n=1 Tax=Photobacterium damselae TaxID=38293 RepID=UPI00159387A2|nr:histidine kinase sensor domain-containing protein [Photobacterium damselae]NVH48843.1 histidine kinase sensor domain-containing protein [Photobacterium damselae subsp. damselae]